jgi:glycosyltransferase involved in cell wall biosynthesis
VKIAVYHNLPSGGGLSHLSDVVRTLKKNGHTLHLYRPSCSEKEFCSFLDSVDEHYEIPRKLWQPVFPLLNPFLYKSYLKRIIREDEKIANDINNRSYDVIYIGQCQIWTEPPLLKFLNRNLRSILYCQEPKRSFYEQRFLDQIKAWPWWKKLWRLPTINWMKKSQEEHIKCATKVFCNSAFSKSNIERAYPGVVPEISYIGVDHHTFTPLENLKDKNYQLMSVGALDPSKNHQMAIMVAGEEPANHSFKVVIVTDRAYGKTADDLKSLAKSLEVDLEIKVRIPTEELAFELKKSFAVIYCPLMEPFGIVSIESQSCGTPVLGRNEGGIKETLLNGVGGFRFNEDVDKYVNQLEKWIENSDEYLNFCQQARNHIVESWTKESLLQKTVNKISQVTEKQ